MSNYLHRPIRSLDGAQEDIRRGRERAYKSDPFGSLVSAVDRLSAACERSRALRGDGPLTFPALADLLILARLAHARRAAALRKRHAPSGEPD